MPNAARTLSRFIVSAACALGLNDTTDAQSSYQWNDIKGNLGGMATLRSLHSDRAEGYNESNPGLIALYDTPWEYGPFKENAFFFGGYYNSIERTSLLGGIKSLAPVNFKGNFKCGFVGGIVTGYEPKTLPMLAGIVEYDFSRSTSATSMLSWVPGMGGVIGFGVTAYSSPRRPNSRPAARWIE